MLLKVIPMQTTRKVNILLAVDYVHGERIDKL